MRTLFFFLSLARLAIASDALIDQADYPSPDRKLAVHYERRGDFAHDSDARLIATLRKDHKQAWTFSEMGRHCYFSWSPDSRFLLVACLDPGRAMESLLVLDTSITPLHVMRHPFAGIIKAMDAQLPIQKGHENSAPYDGNVEWESIKWVSSRKCTMQFSRASFGKRGAAFLQLDLKDASSQLKLLKVKAIE